MAGKIDARLHELGIALPAPMAPIANYVPYCITGNVVVISGQLPAINGTVAFTGKVTVDLTVEQGAEAARASFINLLAHLRTACGGDLDRVRRVVRLGGFVAAVLIALACQTVYYLIRIRLGSWVRPLDLLRGTRDALAMAFTTGSSTATMPLTYASLREKVGVSEQSASMGELVGANFNNDGTALYEAMSALFVSQLLGSHLSLGQQFIVVVASIIASVGAAGIPEAGLVTMTLVFKAVDLPVEYVAMLLTVDWFLDRCRTTVNVMGDLNVSCLLDGKVRPAAAIAPSALVAPPTTSEAANPA